MRILDGIRNGFRLVLWDSCILESADKLERVKCDCCQGNSPRLARQTRPAYHDSRENSKEKRNYSAPHIKKILDRVFRGFLKNRPQLVRVRGHEKIMCHLMFGVLALTADQLMKMVT